MIQKQFAERTKQILATNESVIGLAVAGSWLTNELDEFSDLDLIVVTSEKISDDKGKMIEFAKSLGDFLSCFTGEHVGEPRVLICLYDNPLLHVDIKFLTLDEFHSRIETPAILLDKNDQLKNVLLNSEVKFPYPDYQWIEDRFWTWIHYALLKIGRGELLEAFDSLGFLRMVVFGPLLHIKNGNLPRGVRKVETQLPGTDFQTLKRTIAAYTKPSLIDALRNSITLYRDLRTSVFDDSIQLQKDTEAKVMKYFEEIEQRL
jgi:predicted nucleotidyltransferase